MNKVNQQNKILQYMRENDGMTGLEATNILHIMDYRKRISEIRRKGEIVISDEWQVADNGSRYKRYYIEEQQNGYSRLD